MRIANRNKLKKKDTEKKKEFRSEIEKRKSAEKNVVSKTAPDRGQKKPYRF